jgi:hypothetical protein
MAAGYTLITANITRIVISLRIIPFNRILTLVFLRKEVENKH